jgi:hypothetical protein
MVSLAILSLALALILIGVVALVVDLAVHRRRP